MDTATVRNRYKVNRFCRKMVYLITNFAFFHYLCIMTNYREMMSRLKPLYDAGEARAISRLVMESLFGMTWTDVLGGAMSAMTEEQASRLESTVARLEKGEPVQYVLGSASFCGRMFHVEPGVLIPRPETELLVLETIFDTVGINNSHSLSVLDIGTGSGCIAITIALDNPEWDVTAWDISDTALRIAADNARRLGAANVRFDRVDILNTSLLPDATYDLIISNPPYVCRKERVDMDSIVAEHEPEIALFVPDDDPLRFYKAIAAYARKALAPGGRLLLEINSAFGSEIKQLLTDSGFHDVTVKKDQFDNDRIAGGAV